MDRKAEEVLAEGQFVFKENEGMRQAILALRLIIKNTMEKDETEIGFVD